MIRNVSLFFVALLLLVSVPAFVQAAEEPLAETKAVSPGIQYDLGIIDRTLLPIGYSGKERFRYDVSYTGGIKIGELHLNVTELEDVVGGYEINAFVTTEGGAINLIYPIKDRHITKVRGERRLPFHYEVWQKEGYNYEAHRELTYQQDNKYIRYMKNEKLEGEYRLDGFVNNEFSSFFNSRIMPFEIGKSFIVPTFADKKRVEVVVHPMEKKHFKKTIIGPVDTVAVMPIMTFKGLYEKKGDTVIWYTDDECRVPVRINSKIVIGSLTAELTEYENPACTRYSQIEK